MLLILLQLLLQLSIWIMDLKKDTVVLSTEYYLPWAAVSIFCGYAN